MASRLADSCWEPRASRQRIPCRLPDRPTRWGTGNNTPVKVDHSCDCYSQDKPQRRLEGAVHTLQPGLARTLAKQDDLRGLEKDDEVQEQRVILDVVKIELELLHGVVDRRSVGVADLGPTRYARFHRVPARVEGDLPAELAHERGALGARADEAHIAAQYIDELGQLIDAGHSQKPSHPCHTVVVFLGPSRHTVLLSLNVHAAELQNLENPTRLSHPLLTIEDRPAGFVPNGQHRKDHDRQGGKQHGHADEDIEYALENLLKARLGKPFGENHPARAQGIELHVTGFPFEERRQIHDADSFELALKKPGRREVSVASVSYSDDDLVNAVLLDQGAQDGTVAEQLGLFQTGLSLPALHETDEMKTCVGTELVQKGFHPRCPGPAPQHQYSALQRLVADHAEEHLPRHGGQGKGEEQAQGHQAAAQDAGRNDVEDDRHQHCARGEACQEASVVLAVLLVERRAVQAKRSHDAQHDCRVEERTRKERSRRSLDE